MHEGAFLSDKADKGALVKAANELKDSLRKRHDGRIKVRGNTSGQNGLNKTESRGWYIDIASIGVGQPRVGLWLERWVGRRKRNFWCGFHSASRKQIEAILALMPPHLTPITTLTDKDVVYNKDGSCQLLRRLDDNELSHPLAEFYKDSGEYYFGICDVADDASAAPAVFKTWQAADFVGQVVEIVVPGGDEEWPEGLSVSEQRKYKVHRRIERNPRAAALAKKIHGFRCQCCGFDFQAIYGPAGIEFIEAHHLIPLSDLSEGQPTHLDPKTDFAVLCANCHRMIHRKEAPKTVPGLRLLPGIRRIAQVFQ